MLKIRLQRIGRRNEPHFRVVVAEHTTGVKSNKFIEKVGTFNPKTKHTQLNADRITYWISVGAKTSDRVHNMLVKAKIIDGKTINVLPQKSPIIDEEKLAKEKEEAEAKAQAEETKKENEEVKEGAKDDIEATEENKEENTEVTEEDK